MKYYCYLIGWSKLNKYYYGARWSEKANPKDLWNGYYTSSKLVKIFKEQNGNPDIIQVRKTFNCKKKTQKWEKRVLKKLKAVSNEKWLNKAIGGEVYTNSETLKRWWKEGKYNNRAPQTEEHKKNSRLGVIEYYKTHSHSTKGIKLNKEQKKKISEGLKKSKKYQRAIRLGLTALYGEDNGMWGKKHKESTLKILKEKAINRKRIVCKICKEYHQPGYMHLHLKRKHGLKNEDFKGKDITPEKTDISDK